MEHGIRKQTGEGLMALDGFLFPMTPLLAVADGSPPLLAPPPSRLCHTTVLTDGSDRLSWPVMSVGGNCCRETEEGDVSRWMNFTAVGPLRTPQLCLRPAGAGFSWTELGQRAAAGDTQLVSDLRI